MRTRGQYEQVGKMPEATDNQYKYEEMSNKVIRADRRPTEEPNSNPSSLVGQISVKDLGTRVVKEAPPADIPKRIRSNNGKPKTNPSTYGNYTNSNDFEEISYHPTNEETAHIFDLIMTELSQYLVDASHSVVLSAADLTLEILKLEDTSISTKRQDIQQLLDTKLTDIQFNEIVNLTKRISDYNISLEEEDDDGENGVAVIFDEEEDEEEEEEEEEEAELEQESEQQNVDSKKELLDTNESTILTKEQEKESGLLSLQEIDPLYIHRKISALFKDNDASSNNELSTKINELLLDVSLSTRDLENSLMMLMEYDHFDFVKTCTENRWRIVFRLKTLKADDTTAQQEAFTQMRELKLDSLIKEFEELDNTQTSSDGKKRKVSIDESEVSSKKLKSNDKREPQIVDLDNLTFDQGSHLMTTTKIKLPEGSYQQSKKLYDVISIPAPVPTFDESNDNFVKISEMPEWTRVVFPSSETSSLNRIQSKIYPAAFKSDENLLLCAPTGAGKTNVAMLTVLRTINNHRDPETGRINLKNFKIVYIAPLKALVQEQMREFQRRLTANFGIIVNELTGDSSLSKSEMSETQLLVTTPEKWDVITRKTSDNSSTSLAKLIIIDEIHLLHDERGPVLESIVSRTIRQVEATGEPVRLVGLSATLPNYQDVATFLRVNTKTGLYYFDASYRPCPLEQQFIGIKEKKAIKKLNAMNEACYDKLTETLQNKHQLIIFVHSRKDTIKTAKWLKEKLIENEKSELVLKTDSGSAEILKQEAEMMDTKSLQDCIPYGFGVHHAGLKKGERSVIEDLFAQGHLKVLISTATLAWGVNLPAHTVVIKGTETYSPEKGAWVQLSPQDILQMLGRAGRPRYDKSGEGVIITSQDEIQYYLAILNQQLPIESQLMGKLVDNINAEIVLGTIRSREDAVTWLGYTYLYVRMLRSPALYHVGPEYGNDDALYWKRVDLAHSALTILDANNLIVYNSDTGGIKSTELGRIASYYYINYHTINTYNQKLKPWLSEVDILRIFSTSGEFKFIPVRQEEKLEVSKLIERCPYPVKGAPTDPLVKVNILLQAYISRLTLDGYALMADMIYITQSAGRLLRAIHEIVLLKNWSLLTKSTLNLCIMVERRMWLSNSPFRQFGTGVPQEIIRATESSHLPWISYFNLSPSELAEAINFRGHSQEAYNLLKKFPRVSLKYYAQPITSSLLRVQLDIVPEWQWDVANNGNIERFLLLVEDCEGEKILYSEPISINRAHAENDHLLEFTVPLEDPVPPNYYITVISEKWLHSESRIPLVLYDMKLPKKFPAFTELLDLQRIPTSDLKKEEFISTFDFSYFNKAQTQVFQTLYSTNDSLFVGVSKGSGKTVCAELAILNHWRQNKGRIVYISPYQSQVDKLLKTWSKKYSDIPDKVINKLTGERTTDVRLITSSHLILATPEQFDLLSRRWKQRKAVRSIELIIADDAHLVGSGHLGVAYETILARMRFVSSQVGIDLRIVALSNPLANGRDFGEWLGCTKQNIFNFEPSYRAFPISEIRLQSFKALNHNMLMSQMVQPSYEYLKANTKDRRSVVFVPGRKDAVGIALGYLLKADNDNWSLLNVDEDSLAPYLKKIQDSTLRELVSNGIGLFDSSMSHIDKLIIERLFSNNILSVLLVTKDSAYCLPVADNVVIFGTQEYEGKEHRFLDYPINTILDMVGTSQSDLNGKVLVLTNASKLNYYKKFLNDALPIESYLNIFIHDAFVNEISTSTFKSKQDCIDWITFTYFYRRLQMNPSFYDVKDTSHLGISEYLSEIVETTLKDLEDANLIQVDENDDEEEEEVISPLNAAVIASHYNVSFTTMKDFGRLDNKTKLRGILEIITSAAEFESLPIRLDEEVQLRKIYGAVPLKSSNVDYESPNFKAFVLIQAHFSRVPLSVDLANDQKLVVEKILNLLGACIDNLSSEGYLNAINVMELSQMVVQGMWNRDSPLKQIPFVDELMLKRAEKHKVETVYDIMSLEDDERLDVLQLDDDKLNRVAEFVNKYPNIDISYELDLSETMVANEQKEITITLERDEELEDLDVVTSHYDFPKTEGWWVVIGDSATKQLYAIKKTQIKEESQQVQLAFAVPNAGHHKLSVWCMCDSYIDADKEIEFELEVVAGDDE